MKITENPATNTEKSKKSPRKKFNERVPMYDAWYYVHISVNGALEVSVEGSEGAVLVGKVNILLLQRGLGGGGPSDGRHLCTAT